MNKIGNFFSKAKLWTKRNSPEILVGVGIAAALAAIFFTGKATYELSDDFKKTKKKIAKLKAGEYDESPENAKKEIKQLKLTVAKKAAKKYAPAGIFMGMSVAAIISATHIRKGREAALAAAYAALKTEFDTFKEEHGANLKPTEDGKEPEKIDVNTFEKNPKVKEALQDYYHVLFDCTSLNWNNDANLNIEFLLSTEKFLNQKLRTRKYLFVVDVYKALGIEISTLPKEVVRASRILGWIYDPDQPNGDNYISFGLTDSSGCLKPEVAEAIKHGERDFLLEINPDDDILTGGKSENKRTFMDKATGW